MGLESNCDLVRGRARLAGKALLESDYLLFRGDGERVKVPFSSVKSAQVSGTTLVLVHNEGTLSLVLPAGAAAKWLAKIRNPPSLLDKLGVRSGMRVAVVDVEDAAFLTALSARIGDIVPRTATACDVIVYGAESTKALGALAKFRQQLQPAGAIWVVHRKGKDATLKDVDVFAAAKKAGLVDTKVASFSATHTAERLVIPVASRPASTVVR